MYTFIILAIFLVLTIILYKWISQPYFVWKRDYVGRKLEQVQIIAYENGKQTKYKLEQFRQIRQKKNSDILFSLVIPSYNQQKRITIMLNETLQFLHKMKYSYQLLIVNDGSKDKTSQVVKKYIQTSNNENVFLIEYPRNRGKGGAVRVGMQIARGQYHLMVDADGATKFSELQKVYNKIKEAQKNYGNPLVMIAGSRHHLTEEEGLQLKRKWYRKIFSGTFHIILKYFCQITVMDTQCGFKLFTRESSKILFQVLHVERWAFDVQLFIMSNHYNIKYSQVAVAWQDVQGSHLNLVQASLTMFRDIILIRVFYILGLWKFNDKSKVI